MIDYAHELNPEQLAVVENGDGACLVLAGAGSGKTRTITYRVAHLLETGIDPSRILLVTFTNKAAEEMKERLKRLTSSVALGNTNGRQTPPSLPLERGGSVLPWSGTFHHIGYRLLKVYAPLLGYTHSFTVLDSDDSEAILKLCIKEVHAEATSKRFPSAKAVGACISFSRNAERPLAEVLEERFDQWLSWATEIETIARAYTIKKREANAMDFDDLLTNTLAILQSESVRNKYAEQWQYILVDEYQDTNKIQASIIRALASKHGNVLVVGDDAQSIYSFRAADITNILHFETQYPGAKIFRLETNYRSTEEILQVANSIIGNNKAQYQKELRTLIHGVKPELRPQVDQSAEASFVAQKIEKLLEEGTPANEIAVLFRAAFHSQALEVELVSRGIAYDYRGGVRFFERAHIKDVLAYLRLVNNLADTAAWLRVLLHEEGIGPAAADKIIQAVRSSGLAAVVGETAPTTPVAARATTPPRAGGDKGDRVRCDIMNQIPDVGRGVLGGKALQGWENFVRIWQVMIAVSTDDANVGPAPFIEAILKTPYRDYLEAEYVDSRDRLADIKQLAAFAARHESLDQFLAEATLQESYRAIASESSPSPSAAAEGDREPSPSQRRGQGEDSSYSGKIILSTIHQAKGLEWTAVFIINLASGAFPNERVSREANGLEEERRLFYVAITRAKKWLYLTYPMAGGSYGDFLAGPSIFVNEIEPGLIEDHSLLSTNSLVLDDEIEDIRYVSENEAPLKIKPGSFLREVEDL